MSSWTTRMLAFPAAIAGLVILLAGCGGASEGDASLRFVNLSSSSTKLDLYLDSDKKFYAIEAGTSTEYDGTEAKSYKFKIRSEGGSTSLSESTISLSDGDHYTAIGYGDDTSVKLALLHENDDEPDDGYSRIRVFNAAPDAGTLDFYVTDDATDLDAAPLTIGNAAYGTVMGFTSVSHGTKRFRVTGAGDRSDVRLDVRNVSLPNKSILTVVLHPTAGGVLVNAVNLFEQGSVVPLKSGSARLRVASGVSQGASTSVTWGGADVVRSMRAPSVNSYAFVEAGAKALSISVDGAAPFDAQETLTAGGDYTLLVTGSPTVVQKTLILDNNKLPTSSSKFKMRLVHGIAGLADTLSLTVDYNSIAGSVPYGRASAYTSAPSTSTGRIQVDAPSRTASVYLETDVVLSSQAVYSVFVVGDAASPTTIVRRDR